jgi:membrane protein
MKLKPALMLYKTAIDRWNLDKAPRIAAALAYYATFSLAPLSIVSIWFAGLIFGSEAARSHVVNLLRQLVGADTAAFVESLMLTANRAPSGWLAAIVVIAGLLFGAAGLFGQIRDALNTIWDVPSRPWRGMKGLVQDRLPSVLMVFGAGLLLVASLALSTLLSTFNHLLSGLAPDLAANLHVVNLISSFGIMAAIFGVTYKIMPDTAIAWGDVWLGALTASLLFAVGRFALELYLTYSHVTTAFGAAGSLIAILIWVYYSAQIYLFGAELCEVCAEQFGSRTDSSLRSRQAE